MAFKKIENDSLSPRARCPYCGRFIKRGLKNFAEHYNGSCPEVKSFQHYVDMADFEMTKRMFEEMAALMMSSSRNMNNKIK